MGAQGLGSRAIIGTFFKRLEQDQGAGWVNPVSMLMSSDQDSETYKWLGQVAAMREWVGGRNAKAFQENGITITNKHYEATVYALLKELRRDKTGQVLIRIRDMATRSNSHWASLLSALIQNGTTQLGYDGQFFYSAAHVEGENTTAQSNLITTDISTLPVAVAGSPVAPSIEEAQQSILRSITQILSFKDNENEPMNEGASQFSVMVPAGLYQVFEKAVARPASGDLNTQEVAAGMSISVHMNTRLTAADTFFTNRADGDVKPFIRQEETPVVLKAQAEGSAEDFDNDRHVYGIDTWRNVGYGYWQHSVRNQMV